MPQASKETLDKFTEFAKEEIHDHGILQGIAFNIINENFHISSGGVITRKQKEYEESEKEHYAIKYLIEEWDYWYGGFSK